jgi:prevent-host-death family protein
MTRTVNIYEAKTNLSRLVEQAAAGEDIVIAKAGKPLARLVPLRDGKGPRKPGCLAGRFNISEDFDAPLPDDLLDAFEGKQG